MCGCWALGELNQIVKSFLVIVAPLTAAIQQHPEDRYVIDRVSGELRHGIPGRGLLECSCWPLGFVCPACGAEAHSTFFVDGQRVWQNAQCWHLVPRIAVAADTLLASYLI